MSAGAVEKGESEENDELGFERRRASRSRSGERREWRTGVWAQEQKRGTTLVNRLCLV